MSELLLQPVPLVHHLHVEENQQPEARPYDILAEQEPSTVEHIAEAIHVEEPAAVGFGLANEGVEIVEAIEVIPEDDASVVNRVQLTEEHQDYQGPYHYEKPTVQLDYVVPIVAEVVPEVETPIVKEQLIGNNYLPPRHTQENLVKRHVQYVVRRRV